MRLSPVWITGIFVAAFSLHAQNTPTPNPSTREAQINEAKGMPPRSSPADYPSQAHVGAITIAAEFAGHSIPRPEDPLSTEDYVVVETGFFGAPGQHITLSTDDFSLRINGKKAPLPSKPFEYVAATVKDPEWIPPINQRRKLRKPASTRAAKPTMARRLRSTSPSSCGAPWRSTLTKRRCPKATALFPSQAYSSSNIEAKPKTSIHSS